tara:strand:- start:4548 stop:4937 length:390 start_codon:yes stop_codon:yes gene_type:complete
MTSTANDPGPAGGNAGHGQEMTVLELSIFVCVYRAREPMRLGEILRIIQTWFEGVGQVATPTRRMVQCGWLIPVGDRLKASRQGRDAARPLMEGLIRMLDQGTRLIDVALMMSVLRLTKGELDSDHADP